MASGVGDVAVDKGAVLERVEALVRGGDLTTLTTKAILKQVADEFGADAAVSYKRDIKDRVHDVIESMNPHESEDDEARDERAAETADGGSGSPARRASKRRKATPVKEPTKKKRRTTASASGIARPIGISRQLAHFLHVPYDGDEDIGGAQMARTEVAKRIGRYVKEHNLQAEHDGRRIIFDDALRNLFGVDEATYFSLQTLLSPHFEKLAAKERPKHDASSGPPRRNAFHNPVVWSDKLQALLGGDKRVSRPQTVKLLWEYIKSHDLQDPKDKRIIVCDDAMYNVFKVKRLHMMKMNKILSAHLRSVDDIAGDGANNDDDESENGSGDDAEEEDDADGEDQPSIKREAGSNVKREPAEEQDLPAPAVGDVHVKQEERADVQAGKPSE
ncbi:unnamed protein product (mitochondrion) [Plasmodiophora brassicae]|uniref:DM2 domain-containing protein n=1 Tax=Plasmodiophora brassicae TaxID=37360 RepID=A0A0G4IN27_PLABS|nr:hypothetical protein PBRA_005297 [Plasmodiophora brassicae]SPQ95356.1 unnamed protein product [Plasmodiophora brassicae]